ncbi:helix-turn-helix domain-containing protein [Mesorhizobium sp. BR1-1-16]|uniref:helix-turn-helix domain-containing protein n=1 Tax=Mesorhizobium sp. BR1-1-16 TaxID=2876653 RepID=UPI001CCCA9D8|nr:helix-turn-helix domain-containing protein [Mesorhizobium sp. BR1-1-16]
MDRRRSRRLDRRPHRQPSHSVNGAMRAKRKAPVRSPSAQRVKATATYEIAEAAKLLGTHRNTVRRWLKDGLRPLDNRRPILIHGTDLKAFLAMRREGRRHRCGPGEFFCFKCRVPRRPLGGMADLHPRTDKVIALVGLCERCETAMHRTVRHADLPKLAAILDLGPMAPERLNECSDAKANGDFKEG